MKIKADLAIVKDKMKSLDPIFIKIETNEDLYYNHPSRDFRQTDEALRIRRIDKHLELTYKGPKFDSRSKSRKEFNIKLDTTSIYEVLDLLGFKRAGEVKKVREIWQAKDVILSLDNVDGLGEFVELEILVDDDIGENKDFYINKLEEIAIKLGLSIDDQILDSYIELLEKQLS